MCCVRRAAPAHDEPLVAKFLARVAEKIAVSARQTSIEWTTSRCRTQEEKEEKGRGAEGGAALGISVVAVRDESVRP